MNEIRIEESAPAIDETIIARYRMLSAALVSDALGGRHATTGIGPIGDSLDRFGGTPVVGTAFTVLTRPGDNLAVHRAVDDARPGDVLVVDARADMNWGIVGELVTSHAAVRGLAAILVDGAVRDRAAISGGAIPVFARGISHAGPQKLGPGALHAPVSICGVVVADGDLVIADQDGATFVPRAQLHSALAGAETIASGEDATRAAIAAGTWDRSWIAGAANWVETAEG